MGLYSTQAWERTMKVPEVILRAISGKILLLVLRLVLVSNQKSQIINYKSSDYCCAPTVGFPVPVWLADVAASLKKL